MRTLRAPVGSNAAPGSSGAHSKYGTYGEWIEWAKQHLLAEKDAEVAA
jgi:hypothetical protein